ncbi:hypothetical protein MMU30_13395 [Escherichia coli]|nr:hypothetical protein [Escherichia coli]
MGPDPRNFNQRVSLGRNDLLIRTFHNIFLSNSDSAALYCVAKIFPDRENILIYKVNIINASSKKDVFFMKAQHQPTMT